VVVEDPARPLDSSSGVSGSARIVAELPEWVEIKTESADPAYLVLADTFDPGWSATIDGTPAPIVPAYVAFRAVALKAGPHTVVFSYCPAGFKLGLTISIVGVALAVVLWFWNRGTGYLGRDHFDLRRSVQFRKLVLVALSLIVLGSAVRLGPGARLSLQDRWTNSFHRFTWGAGIAAMKANRQ
jgi:hypothetical protein